MRRSQRLYSGNNGIDASYSTALARATVAQIAAVALINATDHYQACISTLVPNAERTNP